MTVQTFSPMGNTTLVAGWVNPVNAYSSNDVRTSTDTGGATQRYENYGISGSGSINKVEVGIEGYGSSGGIISLYYSVDGGSTYTFIIDYIVTSETLTYYDRTADRTWTWTLLNDTNFKVKIVGTFGGCLKEGNLILTPDGYKKIEDIQVGGYVIGEHDGKDVYSRVTAKTTHLGRWLLHEHRENYVTSQHLIWDGKQWKRIVEVNPTAREYEGFIVNIETETANFYGANKTLIHNFSKT